MLALLHLTHAFSGGGARRCEWPSVCPGTLPTAEPTWLLNKSTIIMPCNNTGYTDPTTTLGWGIVDFDWSNGKGTGSSEGWAKHKPMDDEEMLFKQVQMTTAATPGTTVWVYRNTVYGYPWYTSVRKILEDPAYADWFLHFKPQPPWFSKKCDAANASLCSDYYHSQEQSPGFPHGDGDCAAPACDCGAVPCGFYVFNHSSTTVVRGQSFQEWFVHGYVLNEVGTSPLVSGFFWDDVWNDECNIHDQVVSHTSPSDPWPPSTSPLCSHGQVKNTCEDMGLGPPHSARLKQLTKDYRANMAALVAATIAAKKFAWQAHSSHPSRHVPSRLRDSDTARCVRSDAVDGRRGRQHRRHRPRASRAQADVCTGLARPVCREQCRADEGDGVYPRPAGLEPSTGRGVACLLLTPPAAVSAQTASPPPTRRCCPSSRRTWPTFC